MGIEPTRDFVEPHAGFEDQERHQAACHLRQEHSSALRGRTRLRAPPSGHLEAIADLTDGLDQQRMGGVGLDLVPQRGDAAVHAAGGDEHVVAPDRPQDVVARQRPAHLAAEILQQPELLGGQRHFLAAAQQPVAGQVQLAFAEMEHPLLALAPPAQERLHPGQKLLDAEGLGHVVVGPEVQPQHDVALLALGREHDDGHVQPVLADQAADLVAVDLGQHDVQQDQIRPGVAGERQAPLPVGGGQDPIALELEVVLQAAEHGGVVFDDQDRLSRHSPLPPGPRVGRW